ncbi:jg3843 [Pararge aegeria aegeria]|uniref:Jg3843 protein n=1 Tax=Pararge aegeria aegeria TaxID=348720 RepID=A0A8S4RVJ0_9NEOP|nr:jg3843 [Pararge aegeria aegeria]
MQDLKFYYVESVNDLRISPIGGDLKKAMKKVIYKLSSQAETTDKAPKPYYHEGFNHAFALWRHGMTKEADSFAQLLANNEGEANGLVELGKKLIGASQFTLAAIIKLLDDQVLPPVPATWADDLTQQLKDDLVVSQR